MHKTKYKCSLHINLGSQFIISIIINIVKFYFLACVKARFDFYFFKFERVITLFHLLNESMKASHSANLPIRSHRHFSPNSNCKVLPSSYKPQLVVVKRQSFLSNSKEPTFLVNTGADHCMLALALV